MASSFGEKVIVTIFGESHGKGIGLVIDGLPPGEKIDMKKLKSFLQRRAPGQNEYTTKRKEEDSVEFISGIVEDTIIGSPVCGIIRNEDVKPSDYKNLRDIPRPSHADYNAHIKYNNHMDMRGGGPFSGRLTGPLCVAGGIALQILERRGVHIAAHLASVGNIKDDKWDYLNPTIDSLKSIAMKDFPVISDEKAREMKNLIGRVKEEGDSIGGLIECMAIGLPIGLGEPNYNGFESMIGRLAFSIPGVRGISFGTGFPASEMRGSHHNDPYEIVDNKIKTKTNHSGGVVGGITNGMPMYFSLAMKPTSSISKPQDSFSIKEMKEKKLTIEGRHDPCIAVRSVPVVEAICAITILDLWEVSKLI